MKAISSWGKNVKIQFFSPYELMSSKFGIANRALRELIETIYNKSISYFLLISINSHDSLQKPFDFSLSFVIDITYTNT
jgi:hypothetical protein